MDPAEAILSTIGAKSQAWHDIVAVRSRRTDRLHKAFEGLASGLAEIPSALQKARTEKETAAVSEAFTAAMTATGDPEAAMQMVAQTHTGTTGGSVAKAELGLKLENILRRRDLDKVELGIKQEELGIRRAKEQREASEYARQGRQQKVYEEAAKIGQDKDPLDNRQPKPEEIIAYLQNSGEFTPQELAAIGVHLHQPALAEERIRQSWEIAEMRSREAATAREESNRLKQEKLQQEREIEEMKMWLKQQQETAQLGLQLQKLEWDKEKEARRRAQDDSQFLATQQRLADQFNRDLEFRMSKVGLPPEAEEQLKMLRARMTKTLSPANQEAIVEEGNRILREARKSAPAPKAPGAGNKVERIMQLLQERLAGTQQASPAAPTAPAKPALEAKPVEERE